jgi:hypothetical protein
MNKGSARVARAQVPDLSDIHTGIESKERKRDFTAR